MRPRASWMLTGTALLLLLAFAFLLGQPAQARSKKVSGDRIALLYAEGMILGDRPQDSLFAASGSVSSIDMVQKLEEARKDDGILAVVIRVNSPGGSASASQEIYDAIVKCVAEKPVYISMGDICASGGYYISAPATKVWAAPATLTGSIGVIMELPRYDGLLDKIGVEFRTMKAGERKDIGSPLREMTPEEKAILEALLLTTHDQFIKAVADGRQNLSEEEVRQIADGTIWTGESAKAAGLVDELGGLQDVLVYAATQAGLDPEDFVVDELTKTFLDELLSKSGFAMASPLSGIGALLAAPWLSAMPWSVPPRSLPTPAMSAAQLPLPQTGAPMLTNRLFLCETLAGGLRLH